MPESFFMGSFFWIQKVRKCVNLVDLVKSFQTSTYYLLATFGVDTAENGLPANQPASRERASQSLPKIVSKKLEKKLEQA